MRKARQLGSITRLAASVVFAVMIVVSVALLEEIEKVWSDFQAEA